MIPERLQKVLAQAGVGSRRGCEALIRAGRVTVNGQVAHLGMKANAETDDIRVDGRRVGKPKSFIYVMLNKPVGVLSSLRSQGGKPTVHDIVDLPQRLYPAGRLDLDSEGLMILTNDGDLTFRLTHPRFGHEKEYRVLLDRRPSSEQLESLRRGLVLPNGAQTMPARVWIEKKPSDGCWLHIVLRQGLKRQIRESAQVLGLEVHRLIRVRIGGLGLGDLSPGEWRYLHSTEVERLTLRPSWDRRKGQLDSMKPSTGSKRARHRS